MPKNSGMRNTSITNKALILLRLIGFQPKKRKKNFPKTLFFRKYLTLITLSETIRLFFSDSYMWKSTVKLQTLLMYSSWQNTLDKGLKHSKTTYNWQPLSIYWVEFSATGFGCESSITSRSICITIIVKKYL